MMVATLESPLSLRFSRLVFSFFFLTSNFKFEAALMSFAGKLYVADTNNSLIRVIDLRAEGGPTLRTLELKGVLPPTPATSTGPRRLRQRLSADTQVVRIDPITAVSGDLQLQISLASGYHFSNVRFYFHL